VFDCAIEQLQPCRIDRKRRLDPMPTVLNVNDSEANRYTTTRILRRAGFEVVEATDGRAALELTKSRPDLVLLDMQLPDLSGLEVCQRIKAQEDTSSIAVLMTSANHGSMESKVLGLEHGADAYLAQPFEAAELVAMVRSLLRMRQAEQDSRERSDRLVDADRRKDEFLAMLAHELRNPLAAATTALFLLEKENVDPLRQQRARDVIRRQLGNLGRLVDDLLDVSRVTRGKIELRRETVDLTALLQRVTQLGRERWAVPRKQLLELFAPREQVLIHGDSMRLEQIFNNLLDNACKYSEAGGSISVTLSRGGGGCSVRVRDDGIGLAADAVPNVFSLFFQADQSFARASGGLGIGLTLVRTLVELHGGLVTARSSGVGKGSEFEVRLPSTASALPPEPPDQSAADANDARRILIVDDHGDVRDTLRELCEAWGHRVEAARDGHAGVEMALEQQPEIALIDIGMPGIDGYEVARRIRSDERGRRIRLIALTGYGSEDQRTEALAAGFDLHLIKPVDPSRLADLLSTTAPLH
jgi:signal transduction histidine kinase